MRKGAWLGLAAAGALLVATLGVLQFEVAQGGGSSFRVAWATGVARGPTASGHLAEGASSDAPLNVSLANATRARFVLSWTDDQGAPDTFRVTVTAPDGARNASAESSNGTLVVALDGLAPLPAERHVLAADEGAARERVTGEGSHAAAGTWLVAVRLVSAPGVAAPAGGVLLQPDGANDWELASEFAVYAPVVTRG